MSAPARGPLPLSAATLPELEGRVVAPRYDRAGLVPGVVHFGVGGFHRAHQAWYLDRLLAGEGGDAAAAGARDFAISGVGLLPGDVRMRDALAAQDGLFTLVLKHPDGHREARVIGSLVEYLFAPDDPGAIVRRLAAPTTRIAELTVTEGGYNVNPVTGEFDAGNPAVAADAANLAAPTTVFGFLAAGLEARRAAGLPPFAILSCDNVQGNGDIARSAMIAFAELCDARGQSAGLAEFMAAEVAFPNSMVDRITPVTTDADRAQLAADFGVADLWPVVAEPFAQWVIDDAFPLGRPDWSAVGAELVDDVEPYELMKLRLLNSGHQAIAYAGTLAGYTYAHEAAGDPLFARMLRAYFAEARPTLRPVPGIDLDAYTETLIERFANPEVRDTLARLASESSDRIPKWLVPSILENRALGHATPLGALIVASWARYDRGDDEAGGAVPIVDRLRDELIPLAQGPDAARAFLGRRDLFGALPDDEGFVAEYLAAYDLFVTAGARAAVAGALAAAEA